MSELPLWARAVQQVDRLAWYAYHAHQIVRDETLFAWLPPELRSELTVHAYSNLRTYLPGGATYESGLFDWEKALLRAPTVPRTGRVLLGAAGGGREIKALSELGYEVVAFEPNRTLLASAQATAANYPNAQVLAATFADLQAAAESNDGPLASSFARPFDWALLGWGSFTHVTRRAEQLGLLCALRKLVPHGPLALSFFLRKPQQELDSRSLRLRTAVRALFQKLGGAGAPAAGMAYDYGGGFVYSFTEQEIRELAGQAGYETAAFEASSFPHALLVPTPASASASG